VSVKEQGGLSIRLNDIAPLFSILEDIKIDRSRLLDDLGLSTQLLANPGEARLLLTDYFRILEYLTEKTKNETGNLSSRPIMAGSTEFVMSQLTGCNTLYEAMTTIAKTYNILYGGSYNQIEKRDRYLGYIISDDRFPYSFESRNFVHLTMECVMIFVHAMLSLISGTSLTSDLVKVYTRRPRRMGGGPLSCWDVPTRLNSSYYALIYDGDIGALPISSEGPVLDSKSIFQAAISLIENRPESSARFKNVASSAVRLIRQGIYDQKAVAARLNISVATLRRRLKAEGETFRSLLVTTQNQLAKDLLSDARSVNDVAVQLGYSDIRSFSRAFKKMNGQTPDQFRKKNLQSS